MDSPTFGLEGPEFGSGDLAVYVSRQPGKNLGMRAGST